MGRSGRVFRSMVEEEYIALRKLLVKIQILKALLVRAHKKARSLVEKVISQNLTEI